MKNNMQHAVPLTWETQDVGDGTTVGTQDVDVHNSSLHKQDMECYKNCFPTQLACNLQLAQNCHHSQMVPFLHEEASTATEVKTATTETSTQHVLDTTYTSNHSLNRSKFLDSTSQPTCVFFSHRHEEGCSLRSPQSWLSPTSHRRKGASRNCVCTFHCKHSFNRVD